MSRINYSIVIPIFNEEETIPELWRQLSNVLKQLDGSSEVIFVNDGSRDSSLQLLLEISKENPEVRVLSLSRNFGHQPALSAGIDHTEGDAVVLMDGDLQDAPEAILQFVERWKQGYDVVYAIRLKRKESLLKRIAFKTFYRIQQQLAEVELPVDAGIFSLMDRKVVLTLRQMPERNRYLSGLRSYAGFKQTGVTVERGPRYRGEPRVTITKLFKLAFDGIFSFSTVPLKIVTLLGLFFSTASFALAIIGLFVKFVLGIDFLQWQYGLTSTFFLGGVQLLCLGVIGEYIGRIYDEVKERPYYVIREKIGFDHRISRSISERV